MLKQHVRSRLWSRAVLLDCIRCRLLCGVQQCGNSVLQQCTTLLVMLLGSMLEVRTSKCWYMSP